jgi:UDP-2,3-diacylglucosamine pyrophosphatase LpxH
MKVKSLFISDTHLGTKRTQSKNILKILKTVECEQLIINGDFIDLWALKRKFYFPIDHYKIVKKIIKLVENKKKVIYLSGNHDADFLEYLNEEDVIVLDEYIYFSGDKKVLVLHGHQFDTIIKNWNLVARIGDTLYGFLFWVNRLLYKRNIIKNSISQAAKNRIKNIICPRFKKASIKYAEKMNCDIVITGHTHFVEKSQIDSICFINLGDLVESNTFLVETYDGEFELYQIVNNEIHKFYRENSN